MVTKPYDNTRSLRIKEFDGKYVRFRYAWDFFYFACKVGNKFVLECLIIKCIDCNPLEIKEESRIYFLDIGMTQYFLRQAGASEKDLKGIAAENFVYLVLRKHIRKDIVGIMPWFAIWQPS